MQVSCEEYKCQPSYMNFMWYIITGKCNMKHAQLGYCGDIVTCMFGMLFTKKNPFGYSKIPRNCPLIYYNCLEKSTTVFSCSVV